jgi:hypothetical protein
MAIAVLALLSIQAFVESTNEHTISFSVYDLSSSIVLVAIAMFKGSILEIQPRLLNTFPSQKKKGLDILLVGCNNEYSTHKTIRTLSYISLGV